MKNKNDKVKKFSEIKKKHPDAMLILRCGDFYEIYKGDAYKASKILGIVMTYDTEQIDNDGKPLLTVGFPLHALDMYLPKLVRAGCRVVIDDGDTQ